MTIIWRLQVQSWLQASNNTVILNNCTRLWQNGIRTGGPRGFSKGRSSKFPEDSRVRQTSEKVRKTYRPKRCGNNNKDKDNNSKTFYEKKCFCSMIVVEFAYTFYTLNIINGFVWSGLFLLHINHYWLINVKSYYYMYISYMICNYILLITFFQRTWAHFFWLHCEMVSSIA